MDKTVRMSSRINVRLRWDQAPAGLGEEQSLKPATVAGI
jgi:hypothetical protein